MALYAASTPYQSYRPCVGSTVHQHTYSRAAVAPTLRLLASSPGLPPQSSVKPMTGAAWAGAAPASAHTQTAPIRAARPERLMRVASGVSKKLITGLTPAA